MELIRIDQENEEVTIRISLPFNLKLSFAEANKLKERLKKRTEYPFKGIKRFVTSCEMDRINDPDRKVLLDSILSQVPDVISK